MSQMRSASPCRLVDVGVVCALGSGIRQIWPRLAAGDGSGLVERDLGAGPRLFGVVSAPLPPIEAGLGELDCRNNRIALLVLRQIDEQIASARRRFGADRLAVVVGTSTSGLSDAEQAFAARRESGALPEHFALGQLEQGGSPTSSRARPEPVVMPTPSRRPARRARRPWRPLGPCLPSTPAMP